MESIFFDIHFSKIKPDPFVNFEEVSDVNVTHTMLFQTFSSFDAAFYYLFTKYSSYHTRNV